MSILATNTSTPRELIPAGNYIARCYQMIQLGTIQENINGEIKKLHKVRIGWELPTETKVFKEENGEQPFVISQEYTLSLSENANLRKMLASWRGKDFTEDEAKAFDITKLLGVPCMLNVIHKKSKAGNDYQTIASVTPMPKGVPCPESINKIQVLSFDKFDMDFFMSLPDFIKDKITSSDEYKARVTPNEVETHSDNSVDDLPF
jgi:hypothetical protein